MQKGSSNSTEAWLLIDIHSTHRFGEAGVPVAVWSTITMMWLKW